MTELPLKDVDYCKYGMPYRKRTRLWNNVECWAPRPLSQRDCDSMSDNRRSTRKAPNADLQTGGRGGGSDERSCTRYPSP